MWAGPHNQQFISPFPSPSLNVLKSKCYNIEFGVEMYVDNTSNCDQLKGKEWYKSASDSDHC